MAKRDYYQILGLSKEASPQSIKRAYRQLAKKYHPDVNKEVGAEQEFKEIQEAYDVLSDQEKKAAYDRFGHHDMDNIDATGGFSSFDFDDLDNLFEGMFGGSEFSGSFNGFGGGRKTKFAMRGADLKRSLVITFEEAVFGAKKTVTLNREETCTRCLGNGARSKNDIKNCSHCSGNGYVVRVQNSLLGCIQTQTVCPLCHGEGKEVTHKCEHCQGHGTKHLTKIVEVKVPAGIHDGGQIRLAGLGETGRHGGPTGDLYVSVHIKKHKFFSRKNNDLYCEIPITFAQAALGADIELPTLNGKISLKIPAGTDQGTEFRVKEKGVKKMGTDSYGDLYVKVKVMIPKQLNARQKALLEKFDSLEDKSGYLWDKLKKSV